MTVYEGESGCDGPDGVGLENSSCCPLELLGIIINTVKVNIKKGIGIIILIVNSLGFLLAHKYI
jgi:hypothetical protein